MKKYRPNLKVYQASELADAFRWETQHGVKIQPKDMTTTHLFYSLRMIWNHTAPGHLQLRPFRRYTFSERFTAEYCKRAVRALIQELATRSDLPASALADLEFMRTSVLKKLKN